VNAGLNWIGNTLGSGITSALNLVSMALSLPPVVTPVSLSSGSDVRPLPNELASQAVAIDPIAPALPRYYPFADPSETRYWPSEVDVHVDSFAAKPLFRLEDAYSELRLEGFMNFAADGNNQAE
jgi:hypothetical protein